MNDYLQVGIEVDGYSCRRGHQTGTTYERKVDTQKTNIYILFVT